MSQPPNPPSSTPWRTPGTGWKNGATPTPERQNIPGGPQTSSSNPAEGDGPMQGSPQPSSDPTLQADAAPQIGPTKPINAAGQIGPAPFGGAAAPVPGRNPAQPPGQAPPPQIPTGQTPPFEQTPHWQGKMPPGQMPPGRFQPGPAQPGQMPHGQLPPGQLPAGSIPLGQQPPPNNGALGSKNFEIKKPWLIGAIAAVVVLIIIIAIAVSRQSSDSVPPAGSATPDDSRAADSTSPEAQPQPADTDFDTISQPTEDESVRPPPVALGETLSLDFGDVVINNVATGKTTFGEEPHDREATGHFVELDISFTNTTDSDSRLVDSRVTLYTSDSRQYAPTPLWIDDGISGMLVGPGEKDEGAVIFDIPTDRTPAMATICVRNSDEFESSCGDSLLSEAPFSPAPIPTSTASHPPSQDTSIGETVTLEDFAKITVLDAKTGIETLGEFNDRTPAVGHFAGVEAHIENISTVPIDFEKTRWVLRLEDGTQYEPSDEARVPFIEFIGIGPDLSLTAWIYFDIPVGASVSTISIEAKSENFISSFVVCNISGS